MNYSKILAAGVTGIVAILIIRKLLRKNAGIFDDIFFDAEFIPGHQKQLPEPENLKFRPFRRPELEDSDPMFI
ncbi:hypothetical protein FNO01nite_19220 [Flavobacterium noncentrifugens]|uniref:Uncharacterized protein n=1 Tax=Flavobacterium noncentrifugens TaxID=1128970 RepID=A0A1G8YJI1_9FLAO|nr:hypothetical protein [Flavobacterium noncentrifugens]GEP51250.1 hypothetical protein FNO01nite_19220 [Flavobacterium noncentrifugens]SDK02958.1 hypothetical protein SAMN04487935_2360 [Flavobacterium noncentrifugens]